MRPSKLPGLTSYQRHSNLIHVDVGVRGDDGASCIVHPLAHHVFPKETLLLLQNLDGEGGLVGGRDGGREGGLVGGRVDWR